MRRPMRGNAIAAEASPQARAKFIERTTLAALQADMPEELILDRQVFQAWPDARHLERIQIINGLVPGNLTRALAGEDVGTVITRS